MGRAWSTGTWSASGRRLVRRQLAREYRDLGLTTSQHLLAGAAVVVVGVVVVVGSWILLLPWPVPAVGGLATSIATGQLVEVGRVRFAGGRAYRAGWASYRPTRPETPLTPPPPGPPPRRRVVVRPDDRLPRPPQERRRWDRWQQTQDRRRVGASRAQAAVLARRRVVEPPPRTAEEARSLCAVLLELAHDGAAWLRMDPAPVHAADGEEVLRARARLAPHLPAPDARWRPYDLQVVTASDWALAVDLAPLCREVAVHAADGRWSLRLRRGGRDVVLEGDDPWLARAAAAMPGGFSLARAGPRAA